MVARLALLMSHASRSLRGAARETHLLACLRRAGVEARLFRMHPGAEVEEEVVGEGVPACFCPADDPALPPHRQVSAGLAARLRAFAPDVLVLKGLNYAVGGMARAAIPTARLVLAVGGDVRDKLLPEAALVLGEYEEQLRRAFPAQAAAGRTMVLPKWVDWAAAGDGAPPAAPDFDIANVGSFHEARKNQGALLPLAARHRVVFVGGGDRLPATRATAPPGTRFLAHVEAAEVYRVLRRSRMLVHVSTMDGLPRALVEAMACGLPVLAYRRTIGGGVPPGAGFLLAEAALPHAVEMLMADDALRIRMGRAARRHAERAHGPAAIAAAAAEMLARLRRG